MPVWLYVYVRALWMIEQRGEAKEKKGEREGKSRKKFGTLRKSKDKDQKVRVL